MSQHKSTPEGRRRPLGVLAVAGVLTICGLPASAAAAPITFTVGASTQPLMEDFSSLPAGSIAYFDGNGLQIAESFAGLTVNDPGSPLFEFYTGSPTAPLALSVGVAAEGISSNTGGFVALRGGTGPGTLQGVAAVLFDYDVLELGFTLAGANGGASNFRFYAADGSLLDTVVVPSLQNLSYTFVSAVPFRGVALENSDPAGVVYDDFRFASAASVPEPASLTLLGTGLACAAWRRARQRR
jgi:hypothetical protein